MIVRRDAFRASKIMEERVKKAENITILFNSETDEILGDGQLVSAVRVRNNKTGELSEIPITGFFVAISLMRISSLLICLWTKMVISKIYQEVAVPM